MSQMPYRPRGQFRGQLPPLSDIYRPLDRDEFRILQIHGYDSYGILRCSLRHVPFKQDVMVSYSAISYTWNEAEKLWYGDYDTSPKPVRIDGVAVLVPDKVANIICTAVQHRKDFIWIDQLCINQTDKAEKSHQVTRMGCIYSNATEVLSFLGSPNRDTDEIFDQANNNNTSTNNLTGKPTYKLLPKLMIAITNFFANDYWRRAWIFQEIAIARTITIFCGSRIASLDAIFHLCKYAAELGDSPMTGVSGYVTMLRIIRHSKPVFKRLWKNGSIDGQDPSNYAMKGMRTSFIDVLRESRRHNGCYDPRDMLYSRLALAEDAKMLIPCTDYDMPVEELYKRFATNCVILTNSLEIITFATHGKMNLPTWIPDWTSLSTGWCDDGKQNTLKASLSRLSWNDVGLPRITRCRSEMMVQGRILRTIQHRDREALYYSTVLNVTRFADGPPRSEVPRPGDLMCVLRGCPLLVYLRPVGQCFVIVGRSSNVQNKLYLPQAGVLRAVETAEGVETGVWELEGFDAVQGMKEETFRIR